MSTYTGNYKWQNHNSLKQSEIPRQDAGCQVALEETPEVNIQLAT
jgi:hypothetical protein